MELSLLLLVLICPISMGLMMLFMLRGHRSASRDRREDKAER
jgi:hypothetical protein